MYKMILLVVGVLGLACVGSGQLTQPGQCEDINLMPNFVLETFATGIWHEIGKATNPSADCSSLQFTINTDDTISVSNSAVVNNFLQTATGTATHTTGTAQLTLNLPTSSTPIDFWILGTDNVNFAIAINCSDLNSYEREINVWQLGREVNSYDTEANLIAANNLLSAIDLSVSNLQSINQSTTACTQLPVIDAGQPIILPGLCANDDIPVVQDFNVTEFTGTWHEISSYYSANALGTCARADYSLDGTTVNIVNSQVLNQQLDTITGTATLIGTDNSGRLSVILNVGGTEVTQQLLIIETDYTGFAVSYTCTNVGTERQVNVWVLSRDSQISAASQTEVNRVFASLVDLNEAYLQTTNQGDDACFYFPTFQAGVPVIFPGQCDTSIPVQANFDPDEYMGLWHDIQSYPSTFQQGTCNNAYYTLTGTTVDVYNTQVVSRELDTINGTAIIPDASQPAKLLVRFPIAGTDQTTSTDYWVLATDYRSYSLVYSCTNLPNNERAVFSWKLSRTKELTTEAITAIDDVTAPIQVLDTRYYANQDQTAVGCFYFPTAQAGVPVIFPGQCDTNIAAVPLFNLTAFEGTWYEVEAYPKEPETGTCINHEFSTASETTFNLVSNQVLSQVQTSATGTLTLNSTDLSGRFWLTLETESQVIEISYFILATDYDSYALAYSCFDLDEDYRAVYSWKLSREQNLSAAADTAINTAMAALEVLEQRYFEDIDQSADDCFVYPEIPAGQPIVLQGQCGTVAPVTDFQPNAFAGTWHEIARYASELQTGGCAASQFTTATANSFTLTQTIIYNERQTVVTGTATLTDDGSGTLTATFNDGVGLTYTKTIYILDTDYTEFALLYSCENVQDTNNRQVYSWKLSKSQAGLSQTANERINQVIASNVDLFENYYQSTGQTSVDCFYYPVFEETPEIVVLPGSCPSVSGVANFQPANYLDNWYDVASYPVPSQNGTCSRAEYKLVDGVITIRNTMVVDEQLRVQPGIARLSNTGTGLLQVTFVLENGEEFVAQYFILDTDYTDFSLVYSCRNLVDGTRQVFSWKLSRTPSLTAAANTAINAIIANTEGLLEEYYQPQSQTAQDCFYVPEPVSGESVLFRGGCEQVSGMQGFNAAQYLGWWHEIERYPVDEFPGQCTSANFVQFGNAINVIETGVYDGVANETTNTAVLNNDGIITINRDGVQSVWVVIGTDYNTYSLLYSCENVETEWGTHRRVWSAKHSKLRSLSNAAQTAIAPLINANPVLHEQFYEVVNQTDLACFHYRDDTTEQVILPGQCDTSIPVQANFDISEFSDTWYLIERYPYPGISNDGTCVGTRYTVNSDSVTVLNWEVLDGSLSTNEGTATVDGATLSVALPVEGSEETVTTVLHILSTNYDDYALAYTCVNINPFQRAVGAFKLSRSRSLSNAGQYAIETYMASREELHQPYFIGIAHSDDCDEPSSALLIKSSIIVMLVCFVLQLVI